MKTFICAVILLVSLWGESNAQAANPELPATEGSRISGQSFSGFSLLTQRRRTPSIGRDDVIIRAERSKRSAYVGEEVVLTYRLFTSVPIVALELLEAPLLTGFWAENVELPEDQRPERRRLEGKDYSVLPIRQQVLFPTTAGKIEIGRAQFSVAVQSRSRGPFDAFFMNVSNPSCGRPVRCHSKLSGFPLRAGLGISRVLWASTVSRLSSTKKKSKPGTR